jgi:hypothetical protein
LSRESALKFIGGIVFNSQFVSQNVITWRDCGRDLDHPRRILSYELIVTPGSRHSCVIDKTDSINLEELKLGLIYSLAAFRTTAGEVINHRPMVRIGPVSPLKKDAITSCYDRMAFSVGSIEVTNDVGGCVSI